MENLFKKLLCEYKNIEHVTTACDLTEYILDDYIPPSPEEVKLFVHRRQYHYAVRTLSYALSHTRRDKSVAECVITREDLDLDEWILVVDNKVIYSPGALIYPF